MNALIADLLTLSRVVAAGVLLWLGLTGGASALPAAALVVVLGWTTDQLDGWFARRSPTPTRLKDSDFYVDLIFYAGILAYLALARFFPAWLVAGFVILGGAAWLLTRRKAVVVLCLRIIDVALRRHHLHESACRRLHVGRMAVVLAVVYRRRLAERVPRWWGDLRAAWHGRVR